MRLAELSLRLATLERTVTTLEDVVDELSTKDAIASAVADELERRGPTFPLRRGWRVVVAIVALVTLADGLKGLIVGHW